MNKNHYYSEKAFNHLTVGWNNELVCEVKMNGEWKVFTEQIDVGVKPLSRWEDLKYLGHGTERRYTRYGSWLAIRKQILLGGINK